MLSVYTVTTVSVIFNDLKLPAVKGTPTDKPLVQVQKAFN